MAVVLFASAPDRRLKRVKHPPRRQRCASTLCEPSCLCGTGFTQKRRFGIYCVIFGARALTDAGGVPHKTVFKTPHKKAPLYCTVHVLYMYCTSRIRSQKNKTVIENLPPPPPFHPRPTCPNRPNCERAFSAAPSCCLRGSTSEHRRPTSESFCNAWDLERFDFENRLRKCRS